MKIGKGREVYPPYHHPKVFISKDVNSLGWWESFLVSVLQFVFIKIQSNILEENKMATWLKVTIWIIVGLLVLGLIFPLGFRFFGWYWRWAFGFGNKARTADVQDNDADSAPAVDSAPVTDIPTDPAPAAPAVVEAPAKPAPIVLPLLNCGEFGSYEPIQVGDNYEYWMEDQFKISGAKALSDLKIDGGSCSFTVPDGFTAIWNQSAGVVTIDGEKGDLGNPVILDSSKNLFGKILSSWDPKNDSAGVMLTLIPD